MVVSPFSKKTVTEGDLVDLHGKVAIVTGGNTGIGYGTVQFLVRKGAKVYIASRNEGRIKAAIAKLESEGIEDGSLHALIVDLSRPRAVYQAAEEFVSKETRLDILVNNAAIGAVGPYHLTEDGLLDIMATNHIGHFVLTNVSSVSHERVSPESFTGMTSLNKNYGDSINGCLDTYGLSKLANILHIKELQRRLASSDIPIVCTAVHPGPVATIGSSAFLLSVPYFGSFLAAIIGPLLFGSWRKGAMSSAFAAAGKEIKEDKKRFEGAYFIPSAQIREPSKYATDARLAKELWDTTEGVVRGLGVQEGA